MPKRPLSRNRVAAEDYESDDGFVEDAPRSKKSKKGDLHSSVSSKMQKDDEGNEFWEISKSRRVQVSEFRGSTMVGIREFYEKDGKMLPGKKGISLTIDQYTSFLEVLPQIHNILTSKGVSVPIPKFGSNDSVKPTEGETGNEDDSDDIGNSKSGSAVSRDRLDRTANKPNHEATSDEEE